MKWIFYKTRTILGKSLRKSVFFLFSHCHKNLLEQMGSIFKLNKINYMKKIIGIFSVLFLTTLSFNLQAETILEGGEARVRTRNNNTIKLRCKKRDGVCWTATGTDTGDTGVIFSNPPIHFTVDIIAHDGGGIDETGEEYEDWTFTIQ